MKAERDEPLGLSTIYFTDRKYHINRPSSSNNNNFRKKQCFICGKAGCWSTKHSEKERQDARNKFIDKRYKSYVQEHEGLEKQENADEDIEALALEILDTDPNNEAENFVTACQSNINRLELDLKGWVERTLSDE